MLWHSLPCKLLPVSQIHLPPPGMLKKRTYIKKRSSKRPEPDDLDAARHCGLAGQPASQHFMPSFLIYYWESCCVTVCMRRWAMAPSEPEPLLALCQAARFQQGLGPSPRDAWWVRERFDVNRCSSLLAARTSRIPSWEETRISAIYYTGGWLFLFHAD